MRTPQRHQGHEAGWTGSAGGHRTGAEWLRGRGLRLALCLVLLGAVAGCAAPGEGKKAEAGYALLQPVIDALDTYHEAGGAYPESLDELVPDYIDEVPTTYDDFPIEYEQTEKEYELAFSYQRPGMNECTYKPSTGWECSGYF